MPDDDVVYFDTERGAALFDSADVKGHFWTICRYFVSEKFLTYCGIASSVTVLNSLGVEAPDDPQIYPYKMFTQDNIFTDAVLHHRRPLDVEKGGNTLEQLASIVSVFDVQVETCFADALDVDRCRKMLVDGIEVARPAGDRRLRPQDLAPEGQRAFLAAGRLPFRRRSIPVDGRGSLQVAAMLGQGGRAVQRTDGNRFRFAEEPRILDRQPASGSPTLALDSLDFNLFERIRLMCRWLAYSGPPVRLSDLLTRPDHSLIDQSRHATAERRNDQR